MDEDTFNQTIRRFLKEVGVTSQREIEKAVRDGLAAGRIHNGDALDARMTLHIGALGLTHHVDGRIELGHAKPGP